MEYTKQFNQLIEKAASEKAFSLDVLKNINEMRDQFEALVKENEDLKVKLQESKDSHSVSNSHLATAQSRVALLEATEKQLTDGLEKLSRDQFELDLRKSVADHGEKMAVSLFQTVFANTVVRKTINENHGGYSEADGRYVGERTFSKDEQITET